MVWSREDRRRRTGFVGGKGTVLRWIRSRSDPTVHKLMSLQFPSRSMHWPARSSSSVTVVVSSCGGSPY